MHDDIIVKAVLKGTGTVVAFTLTPIQYAYYQFVRGELVPAAPERMPMDQNIMAEMAALAGHFSGKEL